MKKVNILSVPCAKVYQKIPGLGQKRSADVTYPILAAISIKLVSSGMCTAIPSLFHTPKVPWKHFPLCW
jgi:hypothetical protein